MKKLYICPTTRIVPVQIKHHVLAGSVQTTSEGDVKSVSVNNDAVFGGSPNDVLSRRGSSIWDED